MVEVWLNDGRNTLAVGARAARPRRKKMATARRRLERGGVDGVGGAEVVGLAEGELAGNLGAERRLVEAHHGGTRGAGCEGAGHKAVDIHAEVDGGAVGKDEVHVVAVAGGAAASGDDDVVEVGGGMEHLLLEGAEGRLAEGGKEAFDGIVVALLEGTVEVEEIHATLGGELPAVGGLAHVGVTDNVYFQGYEVIRL